MSPVPGGQERMNRKKFRDIGLAVVIVPLAIPAFLVLWWLRAVSCGAIHIDEKLIDLINKITA